mgnify:CR=1 FL=1
MLPPNSIRDKILDKFLIVHADYYHPHLNQVLPQFVRQKGTNINEDLGLGLGSINKEDTTVVYESNPENPAFEFKDIPREIDESFTYPLP